VSEHGLPGNDEVTLVWPTLEQLPRYAAALEHGWSPDTLRDDAAREELERIAADPVVFVAEQVDREGAGPPVTLPDGTRAARLPGFRRWIWDGDFCGVIGLRWQPGTEALPAHVLGHIGFSVVPWKRERGYATRALALLLADAKQEGLRYVELTTKLENVASQRVIEANGGRLIERFTTPGEYGERAALRFRIDLP
jgi:predicted acetyltransferase